MTFDFFFYGTLLDDDVRAAVLGRAAAGEAAELPGHEVVPAKGGRYPFALARPDRSARGALFRGIGLAEAARLSFYEKEGTHYGVLRRAVALPSGDPAQAWLYVPKSGIARGAGAWELAAWQRMAKPDYLADTRRLMAAPPRAQLDVYAKLWRGRAAG